MPARRATASSAARALGRLGASRGGRVRARNLSGPKRKSIASHAAKKRWGKSTSYTLASTWKRRSYSRSKSV